MSDIIFDWTRDVTDSQGNDGEDECTVEATFTGKYIRAKLNCEFGDAEPAESPELEYTVLDSRGEVTVLSGVEEEEVERLCWNEYDLNLDGGE